MKSQADINQSWKQTVPMIVPGTREPGTVELLLPPRRKVDGLRRPYEYELPVATVRALVEGLKAYFKERDRKNSVLQIGMVETRTVKYGTRLLIFALSYKDKISAEQWDVIAADVRSMLRPLFGKDVPLYVQPWSATRKFDMRFDTYIQFKELAL